jgi:DNA polymerase-3 subunit alpha
MFFKSSKGSLLQTSYRDKEGIKAIKQAGYDTVILFDDNLVNFYPILKLCKENNLKLIVSAVLEIDDLKLRIFAKNFKGYQLLTKAISNKELPVNKQDDILVAIEDILNFETASELTELNKNITHFIKFAKKSSHISKKHPIQFLKEQNKLIIAQKYGLNPFLAFNPTLIYPEAENALRVLRSIETGEHSDLIVIEENLLLTKDEFLKFKNEDGFKETVKFLKDTEDDLKDKFGNPPTPPLFKYTLDVSKQYRVNVPEDGVQFSSKNDEELFKYLSRRGLEDRLQFINKEEHQKYKERLEIEIDIICKMGFAGYMLIVWDFINAAKEKGIPVGPGRGSAAGSLVAYALKITNINPIPYNLLFERFLNPERVSMPDIDVDFCQDRRDEIIEYMVEKYGKQQVAQVITVGTMAARGSIKDVSRAVGYPLGSAEHFSKMIPEVPGITLEKAYEENPEIEDRITRDNEAKRVWDLAKQIEGMGRSYGVHPAGLVVTNLPISNTTALTEVKGAQVVEVEGKYLEDFDLIKFDFLGLKTLSIIDKAIKLVKKKFNKDINLDRLDYNDESVYTDIIQKGRTKGVFQIESDGMVDLCKRLQPQNFEELVALIALYRPGPIESGMLDDFIERKHGRAEITYMFPELEPILKPTYGVIVYQEQVMQIVQTIGGFSLGKADLVRRAMGKKIKEEMDKLKEEFAQGASKKGFDKVKAEELFDLIAKFAGYGFNKSHSAAYASISYYTAWLKKHYPIEFFEANIHYDSSNQDKVGILLNDAISFGIKVEKLSINKMSVESVGNNNSIILGFENIKGVGKDGATIVREREERGEFVSLEDFLERMRFDNLSGNKKLNKRVFEALIKVGAFDEFGYTLVRTELINHSKELLDVKTYKETIANIDKNVDKDNYSRLRIQGLWEKDLVGFILSDILFNVFEETTIDRKDNFKYILKLQNHSIQIKDNYFLFGVLTKYTKKFSKNKTEYFILNILFKDIETKKEIETSVFMFLGKNVVLSKVEEQLKARENKMIVLKANKRKEFSSYNCSGIHNIKVLGEDISFKEFKMLKTTKTKYMWLKFVEMQ